MTITGDYELFARRYHDRLVVPTKTTSTPPRSSEIPTDEELFAFMGAMRTKMMMGSHLKKDFAPTFNLSAVHRMVPLCCGEDYHTWIEDAQGNVVYDPYFKEYDFVRNFQDCWGRQRRREWDLVYQQQVWNGVRRRAKAEMTEIKRQGGTAQALWAFRKQEKPFHCSTNCMCFMKNPENKGKGYRIVVGSMGWEKADGSVHWEYGDGLAIPAWSR
jgi:hypothetical protein